MRREAYISDAEPATPWLDMIEIKRYKYYTRFFKVCPNGEGYYECFLNQDVDAEKKKRGKRK